MKILIVEDDPASRKVLKHVVTALNYEAVTAEDGESGWRQFLEQSPPLVISDIRMPKMDGLDLLDAIRSVNDQTIVIIVTAYGSEEYAVEALRRKANNFLVKPLQTSMLAPMLRKYQAILGGSEDLAKPCGNVVQKEFEVRFANRPHDIPQMATQLIREAGSLIPKHLRLNLHLGLAELLANAIEHGNLELSTAARAEGSGSDPWVLDKSLLARRLSNPHIAKRKVRVQATDPYRCEWLIEDEGPGFSADRWLIDLETLDKTSHHGRGIFLCGCYFDELEYLDRGNRVRAVKLLRALEQVEEGDHG